MKLKYVGAAPSVDQDIAPRSLIDALSAQNLTQQQVDTLIAIGFSTYASQAYVDQQDGLLAIPEYIDAGDATRLHLAQRNANNGYAGLDSSGRVDMARVPIASTQRWPKPFYSPSAYNADTITAQGSEVTLYTLSVPDPGWPYQLLVHGLVDTATSIDGESAIIRVRTDSTAGPIVAYGSGSTEKYGGDDTDLFERTSTTDLGPGWTIFYSGVVGTIATPNGHDASWIAEAPGGNYYGVAQRVNSVSSGDYQRITATIGQLDAIGVSFGAPSAYLELWGRHNGSRTKAVMARVDGTTARFYYRANSTGDVFLGPQVQLDLNNGDVLDFYLGIPPSTPRRFMLTRNDATILDVTDSSSVTLMGSDARSWGMRMKVQTSSFVQHTIASVASIGLVDPANVPSAVSEAVLVPVDLSALTPKTGATTLYVQMVRSGAAATVSASALNPRLWVCPIPA